ncbi:SDR family oxidoreductase [Corynebacterium sp. CCM 8835]|uniref:SDR family oxidoreductase n=1 Tax=Corynebacterium antarcticum TaxID=2800405 RepID=A0A9Q4GKS2_9CORY|nr:SDR family oxidoreductase [Corynebacterium antarcticum]MCK7641381.1 SDR family oxidoreductase [Corynebacterium antarcticum]MCK7660517.1 SDR family oxidoreductase [Corynebacterium antarcticum]MCL0244612.1 SDR family oxidoreductase [Corynebacterium antarcticum]MCX7537008.1 SDR family oxidoreductase [Corynebacterium antarcticum]MCX7539831.1 SDR family oxidoreductase [Corynebacterium antarcticum]
MSSGPVLLLGGRSDIGVHLAERLVAGREVVLAARDVSSLDDAARRMRAAGATSVHRLEFDATDLVRHRTVVERAVRLAGTPAHAIVAFGVLGDQHRAEHDEAHAAHIATVDYTAQISVLTVLADVLTETATAEQPATIVAFSSVAGWRARRANYVYGSTKAGLDAFCQGLADQLHGGPVRLITARPGFVIGRMTEGMDPAPMSVTSAEVADAIVAEIRFQERRGRVRSTTLWIPRRLEALARVMRLVPRPVWRRMPR